jgi:NAD(P)-dependent dehydrogenase (short-subunit alcohol dehydrogenase family)
MPPESMSGKICIVTGANSGIGKETALGLARMGARVVMVCRNAEKGKAALEQIRRESRSSQVDLLIDDMSSQASRPSGGNPIWEPRLAPIGMSLGAAGSLSFVRVADDPPAG